MKYQILVNGQVAQEFESTQVEAFAKFHSACRVLGGAQYTVAFGSSQGILSCGVIKSDVVQLRETPNVG